MNGGFFMLDIDDKRSNVIQNTFLENREKLDISGVKDVLSFDDQMVIVETELRTSYNKRRKFKN